MGCREEERRGWGKKRGMAEVGWCWGPWTSRVRARLHSLAKQESALVCNLLRLTRLAKCFADAGGICVTYGERRGQMW